MSVWVRAAGVDDIAGVLEFWQSAAENADRPADTAEAVAALLTRDPQALILAVSSPAVSDLAGGDIVGTVIAGWDGWRCHVYRLAVAPDRRREGIGRLLVSAAEQRFTTFGGTRVDAMVLDDNALAHGIWRAHGYDRQDAWSRWVKPLPQR